MKLKGGPAASALALCCQIFHSVFFFFNGRGYDWATKTAFNGLLQIIHFFITVQKKTYGVRKYLREIFNKLFVISGKNIGKSF